MLRRLSPLRAGGVAVAASLLVTGLWFARARRPEPETAAESTTTIRITRHDALGMPSRPVTVGDPARVRALVAALGVDGHPETPCPPDYATAELGMLLLGRDVYARRNVYVWGLMADAGSATVVVVSSSGCRGGPPADASVLRRELLAEALASDAGS